LCTGITDIEIHFLQIKHNAIGIYLDESIVEHLGNWKGKKGSELAGDDDFFDALVSGEIHRPTYSDQILCSTFTCLLENKTETVFISQET